MIGTAEDSPLVNPFSTVGGCDFEPVVQPVKGDQFSPRLAGNFRSAAQPLAKAPVAPIAMAVTPGSAMSYWPTPLSN